MTKIRILATIATVVLLLSAARPALADGIIIPEPPPWPDPIPLRDAWLTIRYHRVSVALSSDAAPQRRFLLP